MQCTREGVFFGGDAAWGPENIIWAVAHGHEAAISIHNWCNGIPVTDRPPQGVTLSSQKMGQHEWSYSNDYSPAQRARMVHVDLVQRFREKAVEVELGFDPEQTAAEVQRCLNCDIQTHFTTDLCIECDACIDVCPVDCLSILPDADESELRRSTTTPALNIDQPLFASEPLKQTGRLMLKDEDLCLHCGLCAERCPTAAWDMRRSTITIPYADACSATPA
jgi:ferredoxin